MTLSNAERQKQFRERTKARLESPLFAEFLRLRADLLNDMLTRPHRTEAERAILSDMINAEAYETDEAGLSEQFAALVSDIVVAEFRRRRPAAQISN